MLCSEFAVHQQPGRFQSGGRFLTWYLETSDSLNFYHSACHFTGCIYGTDSEETRFYYWVWFTKRNKFTYWKKNNFNVEKTVLQLRVQFGFFVFFEIRTCNTVSCSCMEELVLTKILYWCLAWKIQENAGSTVRTGHHIRRYWWKRFTGQKRLSWKGSHWSCTGFVS